jgi:CRP-like cAMP-binding protein
MTVAPTTTTHALATEHRERLMRLARDVSFDEGARIFEEGQHADRFWIVRTGTVTLHIRVPGRSPAVVETLGHNELIGWSWLFEPYVWQLGAEAMSPVRAHDFDAAAVRELCRSDPVFDAAISRWVGKVLAHRLQAARNRLLDLYAPYGSGAWT